MADNIIPHSSNNIELNQQPTTIYAVGDLAITTNLSTPITQTRNESFSEYYTLDTIPEDELITPITQTDVQLSLNYDKKDPTFFARWGSLTSRVLEAIVFLSEKFPSSLKINKTIRGVNLGANVAVVSYNPITNQSVINIDASYLGNPLGISFLTNVSPTTEPISKYRNLTVYYNQYDFYLNGERYAVMDFVGAETYNDRITLTIAGKPLSIGVHSIEAYITPNKSYLSEFEKACDELERYMLSDGGFIFYDTTITSDGITLDIQRKFILPREDFFNIDVSSSRFVDFRNDILEYSEKQDKEQFSNIIKRKLIPPALQTTRLLEGTDEEESGAMQMEMLHTVMGRFFDQMDLYIRNLAFFQNVDLSNKNSIPDVYLENYLWTLGFDKPSGLSLEYLKVLSVFYPFLSKTKGSRYPLEFVVNLFNIPQNLVDFNQYIYNSPKPLNVELLEEYLLLINGSNINDIATVDANGYPIIPTPTNANYFQNKGYFQQFENVLPSFSGSTVYTSATTTNIDTLFQTSYDIYSTSGDTQIWNLVNIKSLIENSTCYSGNTQIIDDPYPTPYTDECSCDLPITDKALEFCVSPIPLYTGCTPIIMDVWYECSGNTSAILNYNIYGGTPPYQVVGGQNGDVLTVGNTYNFFAQDVKGCISDTVEVLVECINPCQGVNIDVDLSYTCILTDFGLNTGKAIAHVSVTGGTPPYSFIGVRNGQIVNDGQTATVRVRDANGCLSVTKRVKIICPEPALAPCQDLFLEASLETTMSSLANKTARVNLVYNLDNLPFSVYVDSVQLVATGIGATAGYLVGNPVTSSFTNIIGAETYSLDFDPDNMPTSIQIQFQMTVVLTNECEYVDTFTLSCNPQNLGNQNSYTTIIPNI